jgi:CRP/FNR family transcriptional regulator, cyclic AMP receptor protein
LSRAAERPPLSSERIAFRDGSQFRALDGALAALVSRSAGVRLFGPNEFVYLQDDAASHLFFVRSGHVRLSYLLDDGSPVLFGILPPGDSFGELGVLEGGAYHDMATTVGNASVYRVPVAAFRQIEASHPELTLALARTVARRYRAYIVLTRTLGLKTLNGRLSQALLRLADDLGTTAPHGGGAVPAVGAFVTQSDLGLMARGARSNVNRALKTWEREGWISMRDRAILILNRRRLEMLAIEEGL